MTDLDGAYARLFALWNARYVAGSEDACSQALRQDLECLNETGGTGSPAPLQPPGHPRAAKMTAAPCTRPWSRGWVRTAHDCMIGDAEHEVPLGELMMRWNGEFLLLWKPQQLDVRSLSLGMSGEPVQALRQRLQQWAGIPAEPVPVGLLR